MKLFAIWLIAGVSFGLWSCGRQPKTVEEVVAQADPAVVSVVSFRDQKELGSGTGFIIDERGLIVTNYHVIQDADALTVRLANGRTFPVLGVVDYNLSSTSSPDFALLKIDADTTLATLPLGDPTKLKPGAQVVTLGDPLGFTHSMSSGNFSGARVFRSEDQRDSATYLQTTAPISPGNSGGPLLNLYGEVVGVNTFHRSDGQNLNFSLAITHVKDALAKHGRSVRFTVPEVLAQQQKREQEQFAQLFTNYEHPAKLFSMLRPRDWETHYENYWRYAADPDTSYVRTSVIAPPGAYDSTSSSRYLHGGIRINVYQPENGRFWSRAMIQRWATAFKRRTLASNEGFAFTPDSTAITLGNLPAMLYKAVGENTNVREVEVDRFIVAAQPNYLISIELASPGSQQEAYYQYYRAILQSFRYGLPPGTLP